MARVSARTRDVLSAVSRLPLHAVVELRSPDGRELFLLGETHVKTRRAAGICRQAVQDFSLRGVERLQRIRSSQVGCWERSSERHARRSSSSVAAAWPGAPSRSRSSDRRASRWSSSELGEFRSVSTWA